MSKKVKLNPGKYRQKVTFQQPTEVENSYGESNLEWEDVFEARVGIFPLSGREYLEAQSLNNAISHKVLCRYRTDVNSDMRILFNGRILTIIGAPVNFQEMNVELVLMCREIV